MPELLPELSDLSTTGLALHLVDRALSFFREMIQAADDRAAAEVLAEMDARHQHLHELQEGT